MKRILFVAEFFSPGGYHAIAEGLSLGWANRDVDVTLVGIGWNQEEHRYPIRIIPTQKEYVTLHTVTLAKELKPDWIVIMMDIPKIVAMFENILTHEVLFNQMYKCAAVFPVESSPLGRDSWIAGLQRFAMRFTFTEFGVEQCKEENVPVHKLPVGLSSDWYSHPREPRMFAFDWPYVLMVAANQMRKNQHGAMMMAKAAEKHLVLVTNPTAKDGWDLRKLARQTGQGERSIVLDRSIISRDQLKYLYMHAESLLQPSLSEGIGFPVYEAQALGCPVVATNCCGLTEAVADKSCLISVAMTTPNPWGNTHNFWPDISHGALLLQQVENRMKMRYQYQGWQPAADQMLHEMDAFGEAVAK